MSPVVVFSRRIALSLILVSSLVAQEAKNDLFDRSGAGLGQDWAVQTGNFSLNAGTAEGGVPFGLSWAMHTTFDAPYDQQVLRASWDQNGAILGRMLLVAGADTSWGGVSVRIGDNTGNGMADRVWFEAAVNAGAWFNSSTPATFNLNPPISGGTATVWFTNGGDTANVLIEGGGTTQTFSASGIASSPFVPTSRSAGMGAVHRVRVDDFQAWVGSPTDPAWTATQARVGSSSALLITGAQPGGATLGVGISLAPPSPVLTPFGVLGLAAPIDVPIYLSPDLSGRAELVLPPWDVSLRGLTIQTQCVDLLAGRLSNWFTIDVL